MNNCIICQKWKWTTVKHMKPNLSPHERFSLLRKEIPQAYNTIKRFKAIKLTNLNNSYLESKAKFPFN